MTIASGPDDLVIVILVDFNRGIIEFLEDEFAKIGGISKTATFPILKSFDKWVISG